MKDRRNKNRYHCPVEATLALIGGKYKALILWHLIDDTLRFSELSRRIADVTPKMLTQQLRELEEDQLVIRTVYPVVPPKVEYSLSDFGRSMIPVLDAMCNWGADYLQADPSCPPDPSGPSCQSRPSCLSRSSGAVTPCTKARDANGLL